MIGFIRVCAIAAIAAAGLPAAAEAQGSLRFGVSVGASLPVGDLGEANDVGFALGAHALYDFPLFPPDLRFEIQHNRMKESQGGANTLVTSGTVNLEWQPAISPGLVAPYLTGGIGGYFIQATLRGSTPTTTRYDDVMTFGINAGGGIRFQLTGVGAYVEARYHWADHDDIVAGTVTYVPLVFGLTF